MFRKHRLKSAIPFVLLLLAVAAEGSDSSVYVTMDDGMRLAADVYLPDTDYSKLPTLLVMTRYGRATRMSAGGIAAINELGFAVLVFDMRGSGASEGSRHAIFSAEERADIGQLLDWVSNQDWSDGRIVTTGVSYDANLAEFALISGHPAVRAAVSRFGDYDLYRHLIAPGGIRNRSLMNAWGGLVYSADRSIGCLLNVKGCAGQPHLKPVDSDKDLEALRAALLQHQKNWNPVNATLGYEFIDDVTPSGRRLSDGFLSSYHRALRESTLPVQIWASWMDAATAETALIRYLISKDAPIEVYIGAWAHGGGLRVDPFFTEQQRLEQDPIQPYQEFAEYLLCAASESYPERVIHYYTMGGGGWRDSDVWPPAGIANLRFFLGSGHSLIPAKAADGDGADDYAVDFGVTTGQANRWHTQLGGGAVSYDGWSSMHDRMLVYTSAALGSALEITGSPAVTLALSSSRPDAAVHVYLSAISPSGDVVYLTEGQLRLSNRTPAPSTEAFPPQFSAGSSFLRQDAMPLTPGDVYTVRVRLLPTSVLLQRGYRIRLAVAGHDADTFARYPAEGDVELRIYRSDRNASFLELPHAGAGERVANAPSVNRLAQ